MRRGIATFASQKHLTREGIRLRLGQEKEIYISCHGSVSRNGMQGGVKDSQVGVTDGLLSFLVSFPVEAKVQSLLHLSIYVLSFPCICLSGASLDLAVAISSKHGLSY